jgi:hypothetical protein
MWKKLILLHSSKSLLKGCYFHFMNKDDYKLLLKVVIDSGKTFLLIQIYAN